VGRVSDELGVRVYLDANVVIYAVEGFADVAAQTQALLLALDASEIVAVTSELTLAEVLVKPLRDQNQAGVAAYQAFLTPTPVLQLVPVSRDVLEEAARLRATTNLRLPDAIHLATARLAGCDSFLTNDDLFKPAGPVVPVKILSEISLI
jgi:predicted nucleic acid-binding protein